MTDLFEQMLYGLVTHNRQEGDDGKSDQRRHYHSQFWRPGCRDHCSGQAVGQFGS